MDAIGLANSSVNLFDSSVNTVSYINTVLHQTDLKEINTIVTSIAAIISIFIAVSALIRAKLPLSSTLILLFATACSIAISFVSIALQDIELRAALTISIVTFIPLALYKIYTLSKPVWGMMWLFRLVTLVSFAVIFVWVVIEVNRVSHGDTSLPNLLHIIFGG